MALLFEKLETRLNIGHFHPPTKIVAAIRGAVFLKACGTESASHLNPDREKCFNFFQE